MCAKAVAHRGGGTYGSYSTGPGSQEAWCGLSEVAAHVDDRGRQGGDGETKSGDDW